jgi:hypothetical protein
VHRIDLLTVSIIAGLLSACSPTSETGRSASFETGAPAARETVVSAPSDDYVWARTDGQRMATNPELLRKGQADQARCRESASTRPGALDMPTFTGSMEASGYVRMGQTTTRR